MVITPTACLAKSMAKISGRCGRGLQGGAGLFPGSYESVWGESRGRGVPFNSHARILSYSLGEYGLMRPPLCMVLLASGLELKGCAGLRASSASFPSSLVFFLFGVVSE